ncbi:putative nuclease HARBI1 [Episyrphus balteatus]|uniref:putative nuclease HARBI1 n=1 Tax=Episyrphus balteatus TaxID=286459 RepID=UPI002484FD09|nr:putative nuclease HARBI1 [Episyrphus balteatus]
MQNKTGMYGVIGVIDGTRIRIDPPKHGKNDYIDRKNITSVCLQAICDERKKFIDIFVGHPGSLHDNRVYENSTIYNQLPNRCGTFYLLGDSAYACSQYMITPYRDNGHLTSRQKFFNRKLSSGRIVIEHSFGILKQRFRQLYYCKLRGMKKLCHFVRACIVLHNMCNDDEFTIEIEQEPVEENQQEHNAHEQAQGATRRNTLCDEVYSYFN